MVLTMEEARELAGNGMRALDQYFAGEEWVSRVRTDELRMSSSSCCILSQLFGAFTEGLKTLGSPCTDQEVSLGFIRRYGWWEVSNVLPWAEVMDEYDVLTKAWVEKIAERKSVSA